jgi:hypothetical protein
MKEVTFKVVVTTDDDADLDGLMGSIRESISFLADEGDQLEDFTEYELKYIQQVDSRDMATNEPRPQGWISWEDAAKIDEDYAEILEREFHDGELYITESGTLCWVENPKREEEIMNAFGAKDLDDLFGRCRADKNDPIIRELYKCIGYSMSGFWEIFYWEVNNEDADAYRGRLD